MSTTLEDVAADLAHEAYDWAKEMDELRAEAIDEFQQERLRSYYTEHPEVAQSATDTLTEAQALFDAGFISARLVFANSATEQALTNVLLRPTLYGLVHSEFAAELVASLDVHLDRLPKLLFPIIAETANVDLSTYCRHDQTITLWDEFRRVQRIRHGVLHRGEPVEPADASTALEVGRVMLTDVCERVMSTVAPPE